MRGLIGYYCRLTALFLLNLLLAGCDRKPLFSQQELKTTATVQAQLSTVLANKQIRFLDISQKVCGNTLPKEVNLYPVNFHPIFVNYTEKNLELVKQHFCEDTFKKLLDKTGKEAIQIALFTRQEIANQFKENLTQYFNGADIGVLNIARTDPNVKASPHLSQDQVIYKARLTPEQAKKLVSALGISKDFEKDNVIVLPTDIPNGYTIDKLFAWQKQSRLNNRMIGGYYEIVYKNSYGSCFLIGGGQVGARGMGLEKYEEIANIQSPALGPVKLGFNDYPKEDNSKFITFAEPMAKHIEGRNQYEFISPFTSYLHNSKQKYSNCKMMKLQDAKRVVQSLQFINP